MKNIQHGNPIRMASHFLFALILISCTIMVGCNKEDDMDDDMPDPEYPVSYVSFKIVGPDVNGEFEYKDASEGDEFSTTGRLYTKTDNPELPEDQIQIYLGKSFTKTNFTLVAPRHKGSYTFVWTGQAHDFSIELVLESLTENFYEREVTVKITELEIVDNIVKHCKGTFMGSFHRSTLNEANIHQINGDFEINR